MTKVKWAAMPFVRFTCCYIVGILIFQVNSHLINEALFTLAINVIGYCSFLFFANKVKKRRFTSFFSFTGFLILISIAYINSAWQTERQKHLVNYTLREKLSAYTAKVTSPPKEKENGYSLLLSVIKVKKSKGWEKSKGKVSVYLAFKDSIPKLGDIVLINGYPTPYPTPLNPGEFDYGKFMNRQGIYLQHYLTKKDIHPYYKDKANLYTYAYRLRAYFANHFKKYIPGADEQAIALALVLGVKDQLDHNVKDAYSGAGAMHVLAVSGLHVGIIFKILGLLFIGFKKKKYGKHLYGITTIIFLWTYAAVTGFSPSVIRASTMFTFVLVATLINRKSSIYNTLAASALCMLVYDPNFLFQVGFQLSYIAVFGIVYLYPKIYESIKIKNYFIEKLWSISAVSIAAQMATFPLSLFYFHQFPVYFLLANPLVILVAAIVVSFGITFPILGYFIPVLSIYIGKLLGWLLYFMNQSVFFVNQLPFSRTTPISIDSENLILVYLILFGAVGFFTYKRLYYLKIATLCVFLISASSVYRTQSTTQNNLTIYAIKRHTCISIIYNNEAFVIADKALKSKHEKIAYYVGDHLLKQGYSKYSLLSMDSLASIPFPIKTVNGNVFMVPHGKKIVIITNLDILPKEILDLAICTSNSINNVKQLENIHAKQIIFDSNNSPYNLKKLEAGINTNHIVNPSYFTANQGAFTYKLISPIKKYLQ